MELEIPKQSGGFRKLGVPTVEDRIAQQVMSPCPKRLKSINGDSMGVF